MGNPLTKRTCPWASHMPGLPACPWRVKARFLPWLTVRRETYLPSNPSTPLFHVPSPQGPVPTHSVTQRTTKEEELVRVCYKLCYPSLQGCAAPLGGSSWQGTTWSCLVGGRPSAQDPLGCVLYHSGPLLLEPGYLGRAGRTAVSCWRGLGRWRGTDVPSGAGGTQETSSLAHEVRSP